LPLSTERSGWGYINLYREFSESDLMLDINYLCRLFQREMSRAAERVLTVANDGAASQKLVMSASSGD
jgi:hypothetical protein